MFERKCSVYQEFLNENTKIDYQTTKMSAGCSCFTDVWGTVKIDPLKTLTTTHTIPPTNSRL